MSQSELASKSNLTEYIVCRIERGETDPKTGQADALAQALGFKSFADLVKA